MTRFLRKSSFLLFFLLFLLAGTGTAMAAETYSVTVNENAQIPIQLTDSSGRTLAPGGSVDTISYIIQSQPEGAKVNATTQDASELERNGKLVMAFSCDTPGTVEIQTFIRVQGSSRYYSGTHTIQVVAEEPERSKIVIMSIGSAQIIVDNDVVKADVAPVIHNDRTYVPLRVLSDIFGAQCSYSSEEQRVTVTNGEDTIAMTIGADHYTVNGEDTALDAPAYIANGRTMVPVRFFAEAFGIVVKPTYHENGAVADIMFQM